MTKHMMNTSLAALAVHAAIPPKGLQGAPRADAGAVAQQLKDVTEGVKAIREDVMPKAEAALKEAQKTGQISAELKAQIDELLPKFNEANQAQAKLEGKLEALESGQLDLAQALAKRGGGGERPLSAGRQVAASDQLKAFNANGRQGSMQFTPQAAITTADGSGAVWSDRDQTPVPLARRPLRIRDLINVVPTGSNAVEYRRQTTRTSTAAPVAEEAAMTETTLAWTRATCNIRKIGHFINVSEEALADEAMIAGEIDGELAYGLDLEEEDQIVAGDGTGQNLSGLLTDATAFAAAAGLPNAQRLDRLRLGILQVTLADYAADAIVLNPTDWAGIDLEKTNDNDYLFGIPGGATQPALWRLPVVESKALSAGEWLVGSMMMAATLYDRQDTQIVMSSEHGTNFISGLITVKATKRVGLAVKRPTSLVTGNFTFA